MQEDNRDRKKVGVLTFHDYDNYGAVLQSYALQKTLLELGYDAELIDYSCPYIRHPFSLTCLKKKGLVTYLYGAIGHICYIPRRRQFRRFRETLRYSARVSTPEELRELSASYDIVLAGSDQIWDYSLTNEDRNYYLIFADGGSRRISYAVSLGEHKPPVENYRQIAEDLAGFDRILVREKYGADWIEEITGRRPSVTCDPSVLFTRQQWEAEAGERMDPGKYILVYQLGVSASLVRFVRQLSAATGLKVQYVPFPLVGLFRCGIHLFAGPREWLSLIRHAEYVVSDSFHGVLFAIIFQKKFYAKVDGQHINRRLRELLEQTGLEDRIVSGDTLPPAVEREIDYHACQQTLAAVRKQSLELLVKALEENEHALA